MAKQKKEQKDTKKKAIKKSYTVKIPVDLSTTDFVVAGDSNIYTTAAAASIPYSGTIYATPSTANSTNYYFTPTYSSGTISIAPSVIFGTSEEKDKLEKSINQLKLDNSRLAREITSAKEAKQEITEKVTQLEANVDRLRKDQRLRYLLDRVNNSAQKKLLESEDFRQLFETSDPVMTVTMAVDIRRSTELMLKAREPELFADFITSLCAGLRTIILDSYGFFDKFTGDGILAFYPDFLSGEDAPYRALKAAGDCHKFFDEHYKKKRYCFNSVLTDIGLGIGIDYGKCHFIKIQDELTMIGSPVVYACRFSGEDEYLTQLNHPAYEVLTSKYSKYIVTEESIIKLKHEGNTLAHTAKLSNATYKPKKPNW